MPNIVRQQEMWLPTGNPDTTNISTADWNSVAGQRGQLGNAFDSGDRVYQRVQLDSGATSATPTGAVAANRAAYWKDKANKIVTNDSRFAMGGAAPAGAFRNYVAGVFRYAATAGNYIDILKQGPNIPVADGGNTYAAGELVFALNSTTVPSFDRAGIGTYPGVLVVGVARGVASGGNVNVDIDIPNNMY